ncbi:MAG: hypothetical protein WA324_10545 [Bryobacteraceae bacterium]
MARNLFALAVLFGLATFVLFAADPPPGLLKKIAAQETECNQQRANYTYRQSVTIQEFDDSGRVTGEYRESREITFSPTHERYERFIEKPRNGLTRIKLTEEDFADIRNIQPFLLTSDTLFLYEGKYKVEQEMDGQMCFLEDVRPRQILSTERFFEGTLWVRQSDLSVVRSEGRAVPQIETLAEQNLFPHFTTLRRPIDDKWWFPVETYADDTLFFRQRPQRIRITIRYMDYKRFSSNSVITFGDDKTKPK